jgi:hypothetical protein
MDAKGNRFKPNSKPPRPPQRNQAMTYHPDLTDFNFPSQMLDRLESLGNDYDAAVKEVFGYYAEKYNLPEEDMGELDNDPVALQGYAAGWVMDEDSLVLHGYA